MYCYPGNFFIKRAASSQYSLVCIYWYLAKLFEGHSVPSDKKLFFHHSSEVRTTHLNTVSAVQQICIVPNPVFMPAF